MGIPCARWGARPFIVHPIACPSDFREQMLKREKVRSRPVKLSKNPVELALEWRQMLNDDKTLNMAGIARSSGVSRARVTQIMKLLDLPDNILKFVVLQKEPVEHRIVSERRLRKILALPDATRQLAEFRKLQQQIRAPK